jgi:hypothetical protein
MMRIALAASVAAVLAMPAFAQPEEIVCDNFLGMDNGAQMEAIAEIQTMSSEMQAGGETMSAAQIHERLTADCKSRPDALVMEVYKEGMGG